MESWTGPNFSKVWNFEIYSMIRDWTLEKFKAHGKIIYAALLQIKDLRKLNFTPKILFKNWGHLFISYRKICTLYKVLFLLEF